VRVLGEHAKTHGCTRQRSHPDETRTRSFASPACAGFALDETKHVLPQKRVYVVAPHREDCDAAGFCSPSQWLRGYWRRLARSKNVKTTCNVACRSRRRTHVIDEGWHDQTPALGLRPKIKLRRCRRPNVATLGSPAIRELRFGPVALRPRLASGVLFASPRRPPWTSWNDDVGFAPHPNTEGALLTDRYCHSTPSANCLRVAAPLSRGSNPLCEPIRQVIATGMTNRVTAIEPYNKKVKKCQFGHKTHSPRSTQTAPAASTATSATGLPSGPIAYACSAVEARSMRTV